MNLKLILNILLIIICWYLIFAYNFGTFNTEDFKYMFLSVEKDARVLQTMATLASVGVYVVGYSLTKR